MKKSLILAALAASVFASVPVNADVYRLVFYPDLSTQFSASEFIGADFKITGVVTNGVLDIASITGKTSGHDVLGLNNVYGSPDQKLYLTASKFLSSYGFTVNAMVNGVLTPFNYYNDPFGNFNFDSSYYEIDPSNSPYGGTVPNARDLLTDGPIRVVAVPEPTSWALFIIGFGTIGIMRRRSLRTVTV